jgi:hypothetical protein
MLLLENRAPEAVQRRIEAIGNLRPLASNNSCQAGGFCCCLLATAKFSSWFDTLLFETVLFETVLFETVLLATAILRLHGQDFQAANLRTSRLMALLS